MQIAEFHHFLGNVQHRIVQTMDKGVTIREDGGKDGGE